MTIGMADNYSKSMENYVKWLQGSRRDVDWCKLSYLLDNLDEVNRCDGLLLTGGGDVDPALYGRKDAYPLVEDVDLQRDKFEMEIIARAVEHDVPMLCICRGMQIANVAMGGTLIPDVRSAGFKGHRNEKGSDGVHPVVVEQKTLFREIVGVEKGQTNTNHHQAVDRPGRGLRVTARSADGALLPGVAERTGKTGLQ